MRLDTTMDGAGRLTGNLTPEGAAAVQAVLEALGKKRGREDTRTAAQRYHDALQEGCELLIRSKMVPDRAGADTHVDAQYALAKLAIDFVSGPGGIASVLRTSLLPAPYNTRSFPLDVGYSASIPESIRRAVILRDQYCAWPGGCDKRPAACDVHHVKHKKDGGPTSVSQCLLLCQYHHDICIHRWGWETELLPDSAVLARGPGGQILRSRSPPPAQAT